MLKEKTINLTKPIKKENYIKIHRNELYDIDKIPIQTIEKIIKKRNDFNKIYNYKQIKKSDLVAYVTTINAVAVDSEGVLWVDFNVVIYSN